jgi:hypothetical protein
MKKLMVAGMVTFGVALLLAGAAWTQELSTYFAFQFPDGMVPEFNGDLSDWDIVPEAYKIRTEDMYDTQGGRGKAGTGPNLEDFAALVMIGWNPTDNKYYVAAQVFDDVHLIRCEGTGTGDPGMDRLEVCIDADNSGGQFKGFSVDELGEEQWKLTEGAQAQQQGFSYPPECIISWDASTWTFDPPYARLGFDYAGEFEGEGTMTYEVALTAWDNLNYQGPDESIMHSFVEGEVIGLEVVLTDPDVEDNMWENFWQIGGLGGTFMNADAHSDVVMAPLEPDITAVSPASWGKIKATFE